MATHRSRTRNPPQYIDWPQQGNHKDTNYPPDEKEQHANIPAKLTKPKPGSSSKKRMSELRRKVVNQIKSKKKIVTRAKLPTLSKGKYNEESHLYTPEYQHTIPFASVGSMSEELSPSQIRIADLEGIIENLDRENVDLKEKLKHNTTEIRQLREDNEILKRQCSEAAIKTYRPQTQLPLAKPESEIVKDWHNLAYNVNNFVENHFRNVSESRVASWAGLQQKHLREVAEAPQDIVTSHESGLALIKALVWIALKQFTFGGVASGGAMCWAGRYRGDLRKLSNRLEFDNIVEGFIPLNDQWRTLTTNMISILVSPEQRDQEVQRVIIEMDDMLVPSYLRIQRSQQYQRDLRSLINKAIKMDLLLSGQTDVYGINWPTIGRFNVKFDQSIMMLAAGSPPAEGSFVRFVIQPSLHQAEGQEDGYSNFTVLDQSIVWMA